MTPMNTRVKVWIAPLRSCPHRESLAMADMQSAKPWTPSSIALIIAGICLIGVGLHFILLRPPLLPEDVRHMALPEAQLDILRPRLELWLTHVFRVWVVTSWRPGC